MNKTAKIAILGHGMEGQALKAYFQKHGHKNLTLLDEKADPLAFDHLEEYDVLFRSPGIPLAHPKLQNHKAKLSSLTRYFFEHCPCPIIGVTGTKGKGTTSTLITRMLQNAGLDAHLGGNIGVPPLEFLDQLTPRSLVVLELSSFQLEDLPQSPNVAVVLEVTQDHLDVHPTVEAYRQAKANILAHQGPEDHAILNVKSRAYENSGQAQKHLYDSTKDIQNGQILIHGEAVASTSDVALRGPHNLENVLPACHVAKLFKVQSAVIQKTLREFAGLPHRLELVHESGGIQYFNDSFSTTPETSIAALRSFTEPLWLIAGGSEKHSDFTQWGQVCGQTPNLKAVLLIGQMAERMEAALKNKAPFVHVHTLEGAFEHLKTQAQAGDVVLLSPAAASFDQFENYKARGERFTALANSFK